MESKGLFQRNLMVFNKCVNSNIVKENNNARGR